MGQPISEEVFREEFLNGTNSMDVNVQDQITRAFDIPFHKNLGATTLAVAVAKNEYSITAANGHGIQIGESLALYDTAAGYGFNATPLTVVDDLIGLDTPAIGAFAVASTIVARSTNAMNVKGDVTRVTFEIANPFPVAEDVTRIMFMMVCDSAPEFEKFGDIAALTRGLIFRKVVAGGSDIIYFNAKTNADFALLMYDVNFYEAAKQGQDGLAGRYSFAGPEKHGAALRLEQGDKLEMIVQDDLTDLALFQCMGQGHLTSGE